MRAIRTDFNEVYDDDYVWAIVRDQAMIRDQAHTLAFPEVGDWVQLFDDNGAQCLALVTSRTRRTIDCKIDWSTWQEIRSNISAFSGSYQPVALSA